MNSNSGDDEERRYKTPAEGLRALEEAFSYWSSKVTELSFQYCIGLIAANWAVHAKDLLGSKWGLWSVGLSITSLFLSLLGAFVVTTITRNEFYVAVSDRAAWKARWECSERIDSEWPFTHALDSWAKAFAWIRLILPLVAGLCFVLGALGQVRNDKACAEKTTCESREARSNGAKTS